MTMPDYKSHALNMIANYNSEHHPDPSPKDWQQLKFLVDSHTGGNLDSVMIQVMKRRTNNTHPAEKLRIIIEETASF